MEEKIKEKTKEKTQEAKETTKENRLMKTVAGFQNGAGSSDHAPALKCRRQIVWRNADAVGG